MDQDTRRRTFRDAIASGLSTTDALAKTFAPPAKSPLTSDALRTKFRDGIKAGLTVDKALAAAVTGG
jgi:hypothetical protein